MVNAYKATTGQPTIRNMLLLLILVAMGCLPALALAEGVLLQVPTGRGDTVPVYWDKVPGATVTVFLFNGGNGYVPFNAKGMPRGQNFLLKSYPLFAAKATNVVVVGTREAVPQMSDAYHTLPTSAPLQRPSKS